MGKKYAQKQVETYQKFLDVGMDTGFQKCWDLLQLALRDPEAMGKDTFGKKRIQKIYQSMTKLEQEYGKAWLPMREKEADVCQRDLDAGLREIWGEDLCPFPERYPHMKTPDYSKGKKNWRD